MRKKTAPRTRKHQAASSPQQSGLIAREKNAMQSAVTKSALDNRFHRTDRPLTCGASRLHAERCRTFILTRHADNSTAFLIETSAPAGEGLKP